MLSEAPKTLQTFASTSGRGPHFIKVGYNAFYTAADLDAWIDFDNEATKETTVVGDGGGFRAGQRSQGSESAASY